MNTMELSNQGNVFNLRRKNAVITLLLTVVMLMMAMFLLPQVHAATNPSGIPKKGDKYTGSARATDAWDLNGSRNAGAVLELTSGKLKDHKKSVTAWCIDRSKWKPHVGYKYHYTAHVTKVKKTPTGVKVYGNMTLTPYHAPQAGSPSKTQRLRNGGFSFSKTLPPKLKLHKTVNAKCSRLVRNNPNYSLAGTEYTVYSNKSCTKKVGVLKITNKNGGDSTNKLTVKKGTYYYKETKAGKGYKKNSGVKSIKVSKYNTTYTIKENDVPYDDPMFIKIHKVDDTGKETAAEDGSLAGAEFTVKQLEGEKRSWVFKTKEKGQIIIRSKDAKEYKIRGDDFYKNEIGDVVFPLGKYTVQETKSPLDYRKNGTISNVEIKLNGTKPIIVGNELDEDSTLTVKEKGARGNIKFHKVEEKRQLKTICDTCNEDITSLSKEEQTEKHGDTYYCSICGIDKLASHDEEKIKEHISEKHPSEDSDKDTGKEETGDKENTESEANAGETDTQKSKSGILGIFRKSSAKVTSVTSGIGLLSADTSTFSVNADENGKDAKAAEKNENASTDQDATSKEDSTDSGNTDSSKDENTGKDNASDKKEDSKEDGSESGDKKDDSNVDFGKDDAKSAQVEHLIGIRERVIDDGKSDPERNPLANVTFKLINTDTGESHEIVTDKDGNYDSSKDDNLWFLDKSGTDTKKSGLGKLIAGTYKLEELRCDANKELVLAKPKTFVVTTDGKTIDLGTIINTNPLIRTTATDKNTGDHISSGVAKTITIVDKVEYTNVRPGHTYKVEGTLMDKDTGNPFLDKDGKKITASNEFTTKTEEEGFTDKDKNGSINITFTFDVSNAALGKHIVAFETMKEDGNIFAVHASIDDEEQTVGVPKIKTKAVGAESGMNIINGSGTQTINDTVTYKSLLPGKTFTVKGWAVDPKTGEKIDGTENSRPFTPDSEDGEVTIPINIDGTKYAGQDVVIYEELYYNGVLVAEHKDLKDSDQTVHVSGMQTEAVDKESGTNVLKKSGTQEILDTVEYKNLLPEATYTKKAWLVDGNGETIDGSEVTEENWKPGNTDGTYELLMKFSQKDDNPLDKVVVFEELYIQTENGDSVLIAEHKDLEDEHQTLNEIKIKTKAVVSDTKTDETSAVGGDKTIIDTITYEGLRTDMKYVMKGTGMDGDGEAIDGVKGEQSFTPEKSSGEVDVELPIKAASYKDLEDIHIFEELYIEGKESETPIAEHKDLTDEDQTIHIIALDSGATVDKTKTNYLPKKNGYTINDLLMYKNLEAGKTYTVKTWAVGATSGKAVTKVSTSKLIPEMSEVEDDNDNSDSSDALNPSNPETPDPGDIDADGSISGTPDANKLNGITTQNSSMGVGYDEGDEWDGEDTKDPDNNGDIEDGDDSEDPDDNGDVDDSGDSESTNNGTGSENQQQTAKPTGVRVDGTFDTSISVDGSKITDDKIVVFQEVYDENGNLIGEHKDLNAKTQTIYIPSMHTKASIASKNIISKLVSGKTIKINDDIEYKNFTKDAKYIVTTWAVDKKTGKEIKGSKAQTPVFLSVNDGTIHVSMNVDGDKVKGKDLVVFEEVTLEGQWFAEHKDIHDKAQTVTIPKKTNPPLTGDERNMLIWLVIIATGITMGITYRKHRIKTGLK